MRTHLANPEQVPVVPTLSLNLKWLLVPLIFLAVFAGFQGGRYYFANRLQELGILCSLLLFVLGAWRAAFQLPFLEWRKWVVGPVALIGGIMLVSSVVFTLNYNGNVIYSFFSAREFMLGFLGPGIYLLCRSGIPLVLVQRVFWVALVALMVNYLFFYFTMDLRSAFFSTDHTISNLVTYDEWRGFRLKPPLFAIMVALLASLMLFWEGPSAGRRLAAVLIIAIAAYIWSIVQFRATLASMTLAIFLYPLVLSQRNRVPLVVVFAPIALIAIPVVATLATQHFLEADGGNIRAKAFSLAIEHISRHTVFGAGEDSAYGDSYQDIVAPYFYPSDLGIVGTTYKYGMAGGALYLWMHFSILFGLWRANIAHKNVIGGHDPLLWAMLMFMTAQTFNLVLNPGLAYAQGITLGSVAVAFSALRWMDHKNRWSQVALQ